MKIPKETIDKIHQHIDIVEVISDFVTLKKKGTYYSACCPFHNEKTPSFSVTPVKGIYKCFGCGKAGDAIQFVMDMEGLNYVETMKYMAQKYGIEVNEEAPTPEEVIQQNERESLIIVLNYAKNYYQDLLVNHDEGQSIGLSYFKERGFSESTIKKFELGYSLNEWDAFYHKSIKDGYKLEILEKAGLILHKENAETKSVKHYDRFRGRVIFPIHNVTGKVIAFGARILKNEKNQPKYINSPETEVYHKSKILYGISQAKQSIRNEDNCYLVEGYTDVISLHQAGIENVVASSGTSLTEDQIRLIHRYTSNITVLYDGDPAGIKASLRGIDMILEEGMNVNVVVFPDNDDPDSYVKKIGGTEFKNFIKASRKDFISFKTELALKEAGNDPLKKAEVIREIVNSISKIPDSIKRAVFFKQCSTLLDIDESTLIAEYNKIHLKQRQEKKKENPDVPPDDLFADPVVEELIKPASEPVSLVHSQEKEVVRLLFNFGSHSFDGEQNITNFLLAEIQDLEIKTPVYKKILDIMVSNLAKGEVAGVEHFMQSEDEDVRKEAFDLVSWKYELSKNWLEMHQVEVTTSEHVIDSMVTNAILRLKWRNLHFMMHENQVNLQKAEKENDEKEIETCMRMHMKLKDAEKEVAKLLGNVIAK